EEARGVFQAGHAVFMRNWPYAWALANGEDSPVRGKVGIARLPRGGEDGSHASALGGGGLAVSRYSDAPGPAVALVRYLTGADEQARRAREGSFNPTRPALYEDPALIEARPILKSLQPVVRDAVPRPARLTGGKYNRLSTIFWNAVHDTLSGRGGAAENLADAERQLERLHRGGKW
ncbi:MAG TPA: extracellular solute-binding protein, partial [Kiloniellales bacterium]|nr:extracellular solute-binding protein [Kiloniellales bacterium]